MSNSFELRDYQKDQVSGFWKGTRSHKGKNPLLCLPTGGGKTIVTAEILSGILKIGYRAVVLARSKELVSQNYEKFCNHLPSATSGVFCAGLGKKETSPDIVFATIQSIYNKADELGERQLVVVDEAHQIPMREESQYQTLLQSLKRNSPNAILLGLTASPYRLDGGIIYGPGRQFDYVAHSVPLSKLICDGYLTKPATLDCETVDLSHVSKSAGDFNRSDVETKFLSISDYVTDQIIEGSIKKKSQSVLVFASGVHHAEEMQKRIQSRGYSVGLVTGDTLPLIRETTLNDFDKGRIRFLINVDVLTIGYDCTRVDHIAICRATVSPGLFYQICGRGFRLHEGKEQCWIQDFGGNIERHGPIDSPTYGINTIKTKSEPGKAPTRVCPNCFAILALSARVCPECNLEFPRDLNIESQASKQEILRTPVWHKVLSTTYRKWEGKSGKPDTLRVDYKVGIDGDLLSTKVVSEWVCFEHDGFAKKMAMLWWCKRSGLRVPMRVDDALNAANSGQLARTMSLLISKDGAYDRISDARIAKRPPLEKSVSHF